MGSISQGNSQGHKDTREETQKGHELSSTCTREGATSSVVSLRGEAKILITQGKFPRGTDSNNDLSFSRSTGNFYVSAD